jgi:lipopolysaccharide export system protein LptA
MARTVSSALKSRPAAVAALMAIPLAVAAGSWMVLAGNGAQAQVQATGGPISIEAENVDVRPQERLLVLTGNAVVIQDGSAIRSNTLRVVYTGEIGSPGSVVDKVYADSEVFYVTPEQRVRGDRAVFDARGNRITVTGRVVVTQGQNVLQGSELVVNTVTRASQMRGIDGRVRAVFFPGEQSTSRP